MPGNTTVSMTAMVVSRTKWGYRSTRRTNRLVGLHPIDSVSMAATRSHTSLFRTR